ncbi:alpha,alpha-trehalose-phosphate synthase [UDP-forming] 1-like isoform X3 [Juglans microcarpa x Juglans regia]|uniref:alpha,alpha-trehalose-phosphate synthase [UDP-forming] 1-like isoform X3 n=1 Tax=Juglans microcarpa x Juglans regia TaxID=2249226 RepID=UPI001B7E008B|nr:alpha,alpha-trehalose-phosphate synthase [UDP-forming] 1-like isoform X3 [Juglans microcarpa x Juglans regia]
MRGNKYDSSPVTPRTRLERLLRERELRKSSRFSHPSAEATDVNKEAELPANDPCSAEGDHSGLPNEEELLEGVAAARAFADGCQKQDVRPTKQRLLVVANRLPVSATRRGEGLWQLEMSVGGLVSALLGLKEFDARWIGWAGVNVPDDVGRRTLTNALAQKRCIPVFLDEAMVHQYYNGYCNNILWPLFHYLGLPQEDRLATTRSFQSQFDAYKKANQMFAEVVNQHYEEGDVVWCHDYHLMFLPKCLKEYNNNMKVGWFLHTPFPSSEIHRTLPSRSELLRSVLVADLVGFHTYDYARHFVSACTRILGLEGTPEGVEDQGKLTRVAAFPIGIDSERFIRALELPQVKDHMKELKQRFAGRKVMLGVDRLDMIKGIPQKILAFEKFLEENPHWRDRVVLLQIAVPTRTDVPEYQKLTSQVHEIVGRINGRFGTLTAVPIHHLDRSLDFHALCALYAVTDVALVTSLRDGMNLVSYEFVACQASKKGVLILSEFAGAAQSLGAGAILVNPWNITEVASSISYALDMPADEREKRHQHNFKHVTTHTSQEWAATFVSNLDQLLLQLRSYRISYQKKKKKEFFPFCGPLLMRSELNDTIVEAQLRTRQVPPLLPMKDAVDCYSKSNNRLLILGFNSTLTESVDALGRNGQLKEIELKLHPYIKEPLKKLCDDPKTTIVVLSGSDRTILDDNFNEYNMWLAAENGIFLRPTMGEWMTTMPENLYMDWVESVKHVFEYFTERTPRSHFELRETSLVWNYKYSDVEFGRIQARDMLQHLWTGPISNASVDVVQGSRSVEVRAVGVTKDEDVYTFFEPELPSESPPAARGMLASLVRASVPKIPASKSVSKSSRLKKQRSMSTLEKRAISHGNEIVLQPIKQDRKSMREGSSVLDLKGDNYFSCAVGRKRSNARYLLGSADDVVTLLKELVQCPPSS